MTEQNQSRQARAAQDSRRVELMPPSFTLRVGNRRLTMSWRARKPVPALLSGLLHRSWRAMFGRSLRISMTAAAICAAWNAPAMAAGIADNALPTGWNVTSGTVTFAQSGNTLNINQGTPQAITNFATFNIGKDATVNIAQTSSAANFLARVNTGTDPSQIYGLLKANGGVTLINQNGILIGPTGVVDVARFIASTLNISDSDFLAGRLTFTSNGAAGKVENQGEIRSATGGSVYLIGANVDNSGIIHSPNGEILLAAGQTVQLIDTATPGVSVSVTGAAGKVTNLGSITAEAGRIGIAAGLISNGGNINASSVVNDGGRIFLRASQNLTTTTTSKITADGAGKGGSIVLYSDKAAYLDGDISAQGAPGKGGYIDTSGKESLDVIKVPTVGSGGEWYIDPYNIEVIASGGDSNIDQLPAVTSVGNSAKIMASTIADQLNVGVSVTLTTGSSGGQAGDITVNSAINKVTGSAATLTLNAENNININADITSSSGSLGLTLNSNYLGHSTVTPDHTANITGATILLNGGILTVRENGTALANGRLAINSGATVNIGVGGTLSAGNVNISAGGTLTGAYTSSVNVQNSINNSGAINFSNAAITAGDRINNYGQFTTANVSINTLNGFTNFAGGIANLNYLSNIHTGAFNNQGLVIGNGSSGYVKFENGFTNSGQMTLSGNIMSNGSVSNTATGVIALGTSAVTTGINGSGGWTNDGNITVSGSNNVVALNAGLTNSNTGTLTMTGSGNSLTASGGSYGGNVSVAGGTMTLGSTQISGNMSVGADGNLVIGDSNIDSGAKFVGSGNGAMEWKGNISLSAALELGATAPALTLNGQGTTFVLKGSDEAHSYALTTRNQVTALGNVQLDPYSQWINYGTVSLQEAQLSLSSGSGFANQLGGIVNFNGGAGVGFGGGTISNAFGGTFNMNDSSALTDGGVLTNSGTFNKNGSGNQNLAVVNDTTGTVNVNAGNMNYMGGTNSGTINIAAGAQLSQSTVENAGNINMVAGSQINGDVNNQMGGVLAGSGVIQGALNNSGTVAPGGVGAVGMLAVQDYTQFSTGNLLLDYASASSYDRINVGSTTVALNGTLQTTFLNGFVPSSDKSFTLFGGPTGYTGYFRNVTGDVSGTGSNKQMLKVRTDGGGMVMQMLGGDDLHFVDTGGDGAMNWSMLSNWAEGYIPTAVDRVTVASGNVANIQNYNYVVDQLTVDNGATVALAGGNLSVASASIINGQVNVPSGFLTLNNISGSGILSLTGPNSSQTDMPTGTAAINGGLSSMTVNMNGGNLNLAGAVRLNGLSVNGGSVTGAAGSKLNVAESYQQTEGVVTLADAALNQASGNLSVGSITADNLVLESESGAITQNAGSNLRVKKQLIASASTGVTLGSVTNQIAGFAANNKVSGDITLVNNLNTADTTAVALNGVTNAGGGISINNTGGMVTRAMGTDADFLAAIPSSVTGVQASAAAKLAVLGIDSSGITKSSTGAISLVTHSPLTIGSGGVNAAGNITLTAGNSGSSNDNLVINGVVASAGGNITLFAGNSMSVNANITTAPPGQAIFTVVNGVVTYAAGVSITDASGTRIPVAVVANQAIAPIITPLIQPSIQQIVTTTIRVTGSPQNVPVPPTFVASSNPISTPTSTQTTGGTPGTFGGDDGTPVGGNSNAAKKPLPVCT